MLMTEVFSGALFFDSTRPIDVLTDEGNVVGKVVGVKRVATTVYGTQLTEVSMEIDDQAARLAIMAYAELMRPVLHMWFDRPDPLTAAFDEYV